jgi:4-amino-4-deoxy-L-arabinose transferase-like glycosyltransferase
MFRQFRLFGWSIVFLLASVLTLSFYFQEGMFLDGITYSALGRNLYLGYGTFWKPYCHEFYNPFYNHPPLLFWILSKFYWLFGDHMYVPKIYNAIVLLLTIWFMRTIWLKMDRKNRSIDWLPFIPWFCTSVVLITYRSTMLESTLSLFMLISIRLLLQVAVDQKRIWVPIILSSGLIFLGFMTKGFVALFPLGFMVLYAIFFKLSFKKIFIYTVILCAGFGFCYYMVITINPEATPYFNYYYHQHVFKAVSGNEVITGNGRYFLILQLLLELSPWIVLSIIAILLGKKWELKIQYQWVLLFIMVGICASFPLFISPKQRIYYLLPSIPYFILAFAMIIQPVIIHFLSRIKHSRKYVIFSSVSLLISIVYMMFFSQIKEKDAVLISDCKKLDAYFPDRTIVTADTELANNWKVIAYLSRIGVITISDKLESEYILVRKGTFRDNKVDSTIDLELEMFDVYKKGLFQRN